MIQCLKKTPTVDNLEKWANDPINAGSIYIKPSTDNQSCCSRCFAWCYYYCFWVCYD